MASCLPINWLEGWESESVGILAGARVGMIGGERAGGSSAKSTQPMGVEFGGSSQDGAFVLGWWHLEKIVQLHRGSAVARGRPFERG